MTVIVPTAIGICQVARQSGNSGHGNLMPNGTKLTVYKKRAKDGFFACGASRDLTYEKQALFADHFHLKFQQLFHPVQPSGRLSF